MNTNVTVDYRRVGHFYIFNFAVLLTRDLRLLYLTYEMAHSVPNDNMTIRGSFFTNSMENFDAAIKIEKRFR